MAAVEVTKEKPFKAPLSEGYLIVDSKKCAGCIACMLACSLVHEEKRTLPYPEYR